MLPPGLSELFGSITTTNVLALIESSIQGVFGGIPEKPRNPSMVGQQDITLHIWQRVSRGGDSNSRPGEPISLKIVQSRGSGEQSAT